MNSGVDVSYGWLLNNFLMSTLWLDILASAEFLDIETNWLILIFYFDCHYKSSLYDNVSFIISIVSWICEFLTSPRLIQSTLSIVVNA